MPYKQFITYVGGQKKYAIKNLRTGNITKFNTEKNRETGIRMREMYSHGFTPTNKKSFTYVKKHLRKGRKVIKHKRRFR